MACQISNRLKPLCLQAPVSVSRCSPPNSLVFNQLVHRYPPPSYEDRKHRARSCRSLDMATELSQQPSFTTFNNLASLRLDARFPGRQSPTPYRTFTDPITSTCKSPTPVLLFSPPFSMATHFTNWPSAPGPCYITEPNIIYDEPVHDDHLNYNGSNHTIATPRNSTWAVPAPFQQQAQYAAPEFHQYFNHEDIPPVYLMPTTGNEIQQPYYRPPPLFTTPAAYDESLQSSQVDCPVPIVEQNDQTRTGHQMNKTHADRVTKHRHTAPAAVVQKKIRPQHGTKRAHTVPNRRKPSPTELTAPLAIPASSGIMHLQMNGFTDGLSFCCKFCGQEFRPNGGRQNLYRHQKYSCTVKGTTSEVRCKTCKKKFKRPDALKKHNC